MPKINKGTPKRPWVPEKEPFKMKVNNQRFYNSAAWRAFAKSHKALNPLCVNFDTCGGVTSFSDHIRPINDGGELFDYQNIQALCIKCNASKTGKQGHKTVEL